MRILILFCLFIVSTAVADEKQKDGKEKDYDEVILKDGRVLRGEIVDTGGAVIKVKQRLGSVTVMKSEIKECRFSEHRRRKAETDRVILKDNTVLEGLVSVDKDSDMLVLRRRLAGVEQKLLIPLSEVRRIEKAKGTELRDSIIEEVKRRVRELASDDEKVVKEAREWLLDMGIFAVDYLRRERLSLPLKAQKEAEKILRVAEINARITPKVLDIIKDFYQRILYGDAKEKIELLKEVLLVMRDTAVPLFVFIAEQKDEFPEVRSFCVDAMSKMHRYNEIVKFLKSDDGRLRFVAALLLTDANIYIAIQQLIDALKIREVEVRRMAFERLVKIAGCDFSYDPEVEPADQLGAISKWQEWWNARKDEFIKSALRQLAPETVSDDERATAAECARKAYSLWAVGDLRGALKHLKLAAEINPGDVKARCNYAILLYLVNKENSKAKEELQKILFLFPKKLTEQMRQEIRYHLGQIALSEGDWKEAIHQFQSLLFMNKRYAPAYGGLAHALFIQLKSDKSLKEDKTEFEIVMTRAIRAVRVAIAYTDSEIAQVRDPEMRVSIREADKEVITRSGMRIRINTDKELEDYEKMLVNRKAGLFGLMGEIYGYCMLWGKAVESYTEAHICEPDNSYYLCRLGLALALNGDIEGARKAYRKALKIDPECADAKEGLNALKE